MTDGQFQDDFFSNAAREQRRISRRSPKYPAIRFMPHVRLPVEYVVVLGIIMLVLLVVAYAAGVENGKRSSSPVEDMSIDEVFVAETLFDIELPGDVPSGMVQEQEIESAIQFEADDMSLVDGVDSVEDVDEEQKFEEAEASDIIKVDKAVEGAYTIQLAAFMNQDKVEKEVAKLRESGDKAAYVRIGKWYQVYVEDFDTIGEARAAKERFAEEYPDCYIRKQ